MAGRIFKTIFDVIGRDSGASGTANRVTKSINAMSNAAMRSKAQLGGMSATLSGTQKAMQSSFQSMAIGGGFMKFGSGILNFMGATRDHAADLEYELATLRGISGASAKELDRLAKSAQEAGIATQFTPTQAVQGLQALAQQGLTTQQQLDTLNSTLMLAGASGGKVPLADAAKLTTQTLKAFGLESKQAGITVDRLVKTTTMSGLAIEELAEALQNGASGAISLGISLEDTMATMGLIKNIIPSAAMAGSAFQILTTRMSNPMIQKKIKKTLGVDVVDQATGQYRKFSDLMVEISGKMEGLTEAQRGAFITEAFGPRAQKGIASIFAQLKNGVTTTTGEVLKGKDAFDYYLSALDEDQVKDFAKAMNDMKLDTLHGQMELLSGSLQTFQIELGKGAAAISKSMVKAVLDTFNAFLKIFMKLPATVKNAISGFLLLSGVLIKVVGGFFLLKGVLTLLGISLGGVIIGLGKVALIVAALMPLLAGLGIGIYGVYKMISKRSKEASDDTATFFDKLKLAYRAVADLISTGALSKAVIEDMKKAKFKGVANFIGNFGVWLGHAKAFFDGVVTGFTDALVRLEAPWQRFTDAIVRVFSIWTGGSSKSIAQTNKWSQRGAAFGDQMVNLSEVVLELSTHFVELSGIMAEAFSEVSFKDVISALGTIMTVVEKIIKALAWLIKGVKFVGTAIGEGLGMLVTGDFSGEHGSLGAPHEMSEAETAVMRNARKRFQKQGSKRLWTLAAGGEFNNKGEEFRNLQRRLTENAAKAMNARIRGEEKEAQQIEKRWNDMIERLEVKLVTAADKGGKLGDVKLFVGEQEFGRLVKQAGVTADEDSYDSPNMAGETIPVTGG
jgi:TP901 family phage tail tape measure protein